MKNKLKYLISVSLSKKIKTKWFIGANVIICLALICLTNIDSLIKTFGGDFDNIKMINVIDNVEGYEYFKVSFLTNSVLSSSSYELNLVLNKDELLEDIKQDSNIYLIELNESLDNVMEVNIYSNSAMSFVEQTLFGNSVNQTKVMLATLKYELTDVEINALTSSTVTNNVIMSDDKDVTSNMDMIMGVVFPLFIMPFFILCIFLVQMIGAEVNDEKTTRGMEIIISNVPATIHLLAKCIAGNLFIILQSILLFIYSLIGILFRFIFTSGSSDSSINVGSLFKQVYDFLSETISVEFVNSLSYTIPLIIVLMFLTLVGYSIFAGVLASMTTNTEDFQQLQTPIMLISLGSYYLAMMAGVFEGSLLLSIMGYVPFVSAILSPSLLFLGQFSVINVIIAIIIMFVFNFILIRYGLRIYKVGILNYSQTGLWKKIFKAVVAK